MIRAIITIIGLFLHFSSVYGFTERIWKTSYMLDTTNFFGEEIVNEDITSDEGIENFTDLIIYLIPLITTVMAIGAVAMVVLGGFRMVLGGASSEQTEKGKGIVKDALVGLLLGLLGYVIIVTLGNILDI